MNTLPNRQTQQGTVLIISLLILLVLTVIGVTGLSNTSLEERMSHNFEQSTLVFQGAESALENVLVAGTSQDNPFYVQANDPFEQLLGAGGEGATITLPDYAPGDDLANADLDVTTTMTSVEVGTPCPGDSIGGSGTNCPIMQANALAQIQALNAQTTHVQGFRRPFPGQANLANVIE